MAKEMTNKAIVKKAVVALKDQVVEDTSPLIYSLAVKVSKQLGSSAEHTDIIAGIHGATGFISKRIVVPGGVTAAKLSELLADVANW